MFIYIREEEIRINEYLRMFLVFLFFFFFFLEKGYSCRIEIDSYSSEKVKFACKNRLMESFDEKAKHLEVAIMFCSIRTVLKVFFNESYF